MIIHYFTPTAFKNKDLGQAYNYYCSLVKDPDDWICFTDRDVFFIQPNYDQIIRRAIELIPNAGLFTCYTNRVGQHKQCYEGRINNDRDVVNIKAISEIVAHQEQDKFVKINFVISGHFMLFKRSTWEKIKFKSGLLGVDNDFSQKILDNGMEIYLIKPLYVYHYYRLKEGAGYKQHLK